MPVQGQFALRSILPLPAFGSIIQGSDSTKSPGSGSIQPMGGIGRRLKNGKKRENPFILCIGSIFLVAKSPLCVQQMPDSSTMNLLPLGGPGNTISLCVLLAKGWQWLPAVANLGPLAIFVWFLSIPSPMLPIIPELTSLGSQYSKGLVFS